MSCACDVRPHGVSAVVYTIRDSDGGGWEQLVRACVARRIDQSVDPKPFLYNQKKTLSLNHTHTCT